MFCWPSHGKATFLSQGEAAPFNGYLLDKFSQDQAQTAVLQVDEYKILTEINKKIISEQQSQLEDSQTLKWIYFVGGALAGGLTVKTLSK